MKIFDKLIEDESFVEFEQGKIINTPGTKSLGLFLATYYKFHKQKIAVLLPSLYDANNLYEELVNILGDDEVTIFPTDEVIRINSLAESKAMEEQRLFALAKTLSNLPNIFITHAVSASRPIVKRDDFKPLNIKVNQILNKNKFENELVRLGYFKQDKVLAPRQFAKRGEIIDVFSPSFDDPIRFDFFDDEVESIRYFHAETERSFKEVKEATILPASELLITSEELKQGKIKIIRELNEYINNHAIKSINDTLKNTVYEKIGKIETNGMSDSLVSYFCFFKDYQTTIYDYLKDYMIVNFDKSSIIDSFNNYTEDVENYYMELTNAGLALPNEIPYLNINNFFNEPSKEITSLNLTPGTKSFIASSICFAETNILAFKNNLETLVKQNQKVLAILPIERYEQFKQYLFDQAIVFTEEKELCIPERFGITKGNLTNGFYLKSLNLNVLSSLEVFGSDLKKSRFFSRYKNTTAIDSKEDLKIGDYVVHENCGIGIYEGIETIEAAGKISDYLKVRYLNEGILYVTLENFKQLRKYASKEGAAPHLSNLNGTDWKKKKIRIKEKVAYIADTLIEIQATRASKPGFAFEPDDDSQKQFENMFPYILTSSQQSAVNQIKREMEKPVPMDHLLAGDVGFGKTEVAFRAAYKAICSGKQVAILCPTTILAKQHYEVAVKRFQNFGVTIKLLSRFVSINDKKKSLELLKDGHVDLIIGTHMLLSKNVKFFDLGLLIVDEEQRFGVTHKEKIKELCKNVDVLTLTATPIPRTLQMSLLGLRSISTLAEAPSNRFPIQTYVVKYNTSLIKEVIARELGRDGQVYYLHNRVASIYDKRDYLAKMFPHATIGVVHGQMLPDDVDEIMNEFYEKKIDILVCTSIIETGIDVSNVNTLIIEGAENFGLSQLYQIKGRIGRGNKLGYAYLFYKDFNSLTEEGIKRLDTIKEFVELGSGYNIALRDLKIRGAGDILGASQSGFIDSIGLDMYEEILQEVINEKKLIEQSKEQVKKGNNKYSLSFTFDSYIPSSFASDKDKIDIYKQLFNITEFDDLSSLRNKIKDMYGYIPDELLNLFYKKEAEILLDGKFIKKMEEDISSINITLTFEASTVNGIAFKLMESISKYNDEIKLKFVPYSIVILIFKSKNYIINIVNLLNDLTAIFTETGEK